MTDKVVGLGSGLNAESFRIPASDAKGHSTREWVRLPPEYSERIASIVHSGKFPYKSRGDLIRHAIHRQLHWLESINPNTISTAPIDVIIEIVRRHEMMAEFRESFTRISSMVNIYLVEEGASQEAKKFIRYLKRTVDKMPEGFWKRMYQKKLENQFGNLLQDPEVVVSLAPEDGFEGDEEDV